MNELYHFGVKGMKWGVRRYQNKDGSLTEKGIKRYSQKGYAQDVLNSSETKSGKMLTRYTGSHRTNAKALYETSSRKKNTARAEKYIKDREVKLKNDRKKAIKTIANGAKATTKVLSKIGKAYLTDQLFFGGTGTKMAKTGVKYAGRLAVSAFVKARGGYDIHWYDN